MPSVYSIDAQATFIAGICFFAIGNMLLGFSIITAILEEKEFQKCLDNPPSIVESGAWVLGGCGKFEEYYMAFLPPSLIVLPAGIWLMIYGYYTGDNVTMSSSAVGKVQVFKPNRLILGITIGIATIAIAISIFLLGTNFLFDYYG